MTLPRTPTGIASLLLCATFLGPAAQAAESGARNWSGLWAGFGAVQAASSFASDSSSVCVTSASSQGAGAAEAHCHVTADGAVYTSTTASAPGGVAANATAAVVRDGIAASAGANALGATSAEATADVSDPQSPAGSATSSGGTTAVSLQTLDSSVGGSMFSTQSFGDVSVYADSRPSAEPGTGAVYVVSRAGATGTTGSAAAVAVGASGLEGLSGEAQFLSPEAHLRYDRQLDSGLVFGAEVEALWPLGEAAGEAQAVRIVKSSYINRSFAADAAAMASLRARVGYAFGDYLAYATGGIAYARVDSVSTADVFGIEGGAFSQRSSKTADVFGTVVGGGLSAYVADDTVLSLEGLYARFDDAVDTGGGHASDYDAVSVALKLSFRLD